VIVGGGSVEQTQWASTKPPGSWTLTINFATGGASATTSFTVTDSD
jgi:hypothetical protein